jgi:8-oxo-dGTP diphosphatase
LNESPITNHESLPPIHVVAGVITDLRGRILLARRTRGRDLAGLWEFPGGKVDPGETAEHALVRELHEELGIQAVVGEALIAVPHRYPHKRLRLDVRRIAAYRGTPKGLDGQALAWVPPHKLGSYPMPAADLPVVAALQQPDRYLVTPGPQDTSDSAWLDALSGALQRGVRRVQLRPGLATDGPRWAALCERAARLCHDTGAQVLVNHDVALASALGTGVHLRSNQLAALPARPLAAGQAVAASCHTLADLHHAARLHCDFAVLGPVCRTASHPGVDGIGWSGFAALREDSPLPLYAIGGLSPADIPEARAHGAQGIAAIRSLW